MRKMVLLAVMMALAAMMLAAPPAAAQTTSFFNVGDDDLVICDFDDDDGDGNDECEDLAFLICDFDNDNDDDFFECEDRAFFPAFDLADGIDQDVEQEAESGDIDQDFDVSQTGDNSNQTVSTQGVANTGNAQNVIDVVQVGGDADDWEFDDVGSSIEVSPSSTTNSVQRIGQAASADD